MRDSIEKIKIENIISAFKNEKEKIEYLCKALQEKTCQCDTFKAELEAKNKALDAFSYSIGHDMKGPLTHIIGFLGVLEECMAGKLDEKTSEFFKMVSDAAKKLAMMIEALMELSHINSAILNPTVIQTNSLINEILLELKSSLDVGKVEWKIDPLPDIQGDRELIKQAFKELMVNAVKSTRLSNPAMIEIGTTDTPGKVCNIFIKDNGIGFNTQESERMFGPFKRLHKEEEFEGMGMGLAKVASILQKHKASIKTVSEVGKGASFYLSFTQ